MKGTKILALIAASAMAACFAIEADACTRVVYHGKDNLQIVGRSLDWKTPIPTNIYVYPRGVTKKSHSLPGAIEWTSKYGSVYAVGYDGGVTEGMNERGLVVNGLFCKGTVYDGPNTKGKAPMSLAMFVAWLLDMNSTTQEVIDVLRAENFEISGATFDGGTVSALHWAVTDRGGNSCIFEFDHGKINIYEGKDLNVLTNDPTYPQMTAINEYWRGVGGTNMLPGTVKSPDRFVRADFFNHHVDSVADADLGASIARTIMYNVSVPYSYTVGEANVSSTQWRTLANTRDLRYYFDLVTNSGLYYIDLGMLDLMPGAPILKLVTADHKDFAGCANKLLKRTEPFTPMY